MDSTLETSDETNMVRARRNGTPLLVRKWRRDAGNAADVAPCSANSTLAGSMLSCGRCCHAVTQLRHPS
ncbi:hypothetical protein DIPPA_35207 [Diplonema papillatum]|nr:hypothetical protein DIPPA_35207 [Diplonema papillatum]